MLKTKPSSLLVSFLLIVATFVFIVPSEVHGAISIRQQIGNQGFSGSGTCVVTMATSGDVMEVIIMLGLDSGTGISTVADNQANSYTKQSSSLPTGHTYDNTEFLYTSLLGSTASTTVTVTFVNNPVLWVLVCLDVSGLASATPNHVSTGMTVWSSGSGYVASVTSFQPNDNSFVLAAQAGLNCAAGGGTFTTISGFTAITPSPGQGTGVDCDAIGGVNHRFGQITNGGAGSHSVQYNLNYAGQSTNLNINLTGDGTVGGGKTGGMGMIGADFAGTPAASVSVIGPCTFFQLQCWWYPLLFMGLYSGFLLMVVQWLKTSPRGKAHVFLSAVTFGSLIAVIFGIMNIVFPLMMLVLNTIIALRLRG